MTRKRILYIDPVYDNSFLSFFKKELESVKLPQTDIDVISLGEHKKGPKHLEYSCYEIMILPDLMKTIHQAEKDGYDGAIIGCFYDSGLRAAREITTEMIVTAPSEASFSVAKSLGENIAIIVGRDKTIPPIRRNIIEYGMERHILTFKSVNLGVLEFQVNQQRTEDKILKVAKDAVEIDGADVIILGCTAELGFYQNLQKELGVPVIDASIAALKYAEFLADVKELGWIHSKVYGFESPPEDEIKQFGLF